MTLYQLKPRFQALLRPLVAHLAARGVSANQVTLAAAAGSVALGLLVALGAGWRWPFLLLPVWLFLRMALNAIDGMLAREFGHKSPLGGYLNELADVVSDAALLVPFAFVPEISAGWVMAVIFLATLSEYAGVMGPLVGASRRYDGPLGKSDRAALFGALGLWLGLGQALPGWLFPAIAVLLAVTTVRRVRLGVAESSSSSPATREGDTDPRRS